MDQASYKQLYNSYNYVQATLQNYILLKNITRVLYQLFKTIK